MGGTSTVDTMAQMGRMTQRQQAAFDRTRNLAGILSALALPHLMERATTMGFDAASVRRCLDYIRDTAPLIIHTPLGLRIDALAADTRYRSLWETETTAGLNCLASRAHWESVLFQNEYHDAPNDERVKYGTINLLRDPRGHTGCAHYGSSYLVLRDTVRARTTWTAEDSCHVKGCVGTLAHCAHVLDSMDDARLRAILAAGTSTAPWCFPEKSGWMAVQDYWECQFHGPLMLNRDFASLIIAPDEKSDHVRDTAKAFARKNNIDLYDIDPRVLPAQT